MTVVMLEYMLAVTGLAALGLSLWALRDSWSERRTLVATQVNGLKWATVAAHVSRDVARVVASLILSGAGLWLVVLPDEPTPAALVAKHALMFLGWCMAVSVFADRTMRHRIRVHLKHY